MRRDCTVVQDTEPLEEAVRRMKESACPMLPVLQASRVIGMLSMENIGEWATIQAALRQSAAVTQS
jgi:predicted transcriptional regulator